MIRAHQPPLSVASLPATGYDGQEVFLDTGVAAEVPHYRWSTAANKWQLVAAPAPAAPACRIYRTTAQSIPNNVETAVVWTTEDYDPHGMHTGSSTQIVIPVAGIYLLTANVSWASDTNGDRQCRFRANGTTDISWLTLKPSASSSNRSQLNPTYVGQFAAGDYVELRIHQNSGGSLNLDPVIGTPWMAVTRISGGGECRHLAVSCRRQVSRWIRSTFRIGADR